MLFMNCQLQIFDTLSSYNTGEHAYVDVIICGTNDKTGFSNAFWSDTRAGE